MFSVDDYFTGPDGVRRDQAFATECTPLIHANALITVDRWNQLLAVFYQENPQAARRKINSGWRSKTINGATPGSATNSTHLSGEALDGSDADRDLARWILGNELTCQRMNVPSVAARIGLWFEDFRTTPIWVHGQTVPPRSRNRIYIPSNNWWERLKDDSLSLDDLQTPLTLATLS